MELRDGRYERLRWLVVGALCRAEQDYAHAVKVLGPGSHALDAIEDSMEEWALLLGELDAAAPPHLREDLLAWPKALARC